MTKIILSELLCRETEDWTGSDECELRIWSDGTYQSHRRDMNTDDIWALNIPLDFHSKVRIKLYDLDNGWGDSHDHLGTIIIRHSQPEGSGTFNKDGCDYELSWAKR